MIFQSLSLLTNIRSSCPCNVLCILAAVPLDCCIQLQMLCHLSHRGTAIMISSAAVAGGRPHPLDSAGCKDSFLHQHRLDAEAEMTSQHTVMSGHKMSNCGQTPKFWRMVPILSRIDMPLITASPLVGAIIPANEWSTRCNASRAQSSDEKLLNLQIRGAWTETQPRWLMLISHVVYVSRPVRMLMVVVLPAPLCPSSPVMLPR
jgi:hypothetical protein